MYATPHWVDRRHGWEPVKTKYKEIRWGDWVHLVNEPSAKKAKAFFENMKTKSPLRFEYWKSKRNKQWYWRIRAGNAEPIAQGEGYKRKSGVLKVFHLLFNFEAQPVLSDVTLQEAGFKFALDRHPLRYTSKIRGFPAPTKLGRKPKSVKWGKLNRNWP